MAAATKRLLQNRTFRSVKCLVFFMLVTLCVEGKMMFHLLGTNGFLLKIENERLTAAFSKKFVFTISNSRVTIVHGYHIVLVICCAHAYVDTGHS